MKSMDARQAVVQRLHLPVRAPPKGAAAQQQNDGDEHAAEHPDHQGDVTRR
jgi:hypothetical protein